MKTVPTVTLHRSSLGNAAKVIRENLIEMGLDPSSLPMLLPYGSSLGPFFEELGVILGVELDEPKFYQGDLNSALEPRVLMPEGPAGPPPVEPPVLIGQVPDFTLPVGVDWIHDFTVYFTGVITDWTGNTFPVFLSMNVDDSGLSAHAPSPGSVGAHVSSVTARNWNDGLPLDTDTNDFTITVIEVAVIFVGPIPDQVGEVGAEFLFEAAAFFENFPTEYSISQVPPAGIVFDTVTGISSGTPNTVVLANSAAPYIITGTNDAGSAISNEFDWSVNSSE